MIPEDCILVLERTTNASRAQLWSAWSDPELLMRWFCPLPYRVVECTLELWPGGCFFTQMQGPDGVNLPASPGCFLVIEPQRRLVFTDALGPGFQPLEKSFFSCEITMEDLPEGQVRYRARAIHKNSEGAAQHAAMGFQEGWGKAFDQLEELALQLANS